jgi:hypothetical protein
MSPFPVPHRLLPVALVFAATATVAQPAPRSKADPLNVDASVPPLIFRSALAGYRRHAEQPAGSWREVNETVNRIGGWRAYAREANDAAAAPAAPEAKPATASPAQPAAPPPPAGHAGHQKP